MTKVKFPKSMNWLRQDYPNGEFLMLDVNHAILKTCTEISLRCNDHDWLRTGSFHTKDFPRFINYNNRKCHDKFKNIFKLYCINVKK